MASKTLFFVLALMLVVAALAEFEFEDEGADVEFLKRDADMQELLMAQKRGRSLKKYKYCPQFSQDCWCNRRKGTIVFCNGAGKGDNL